MKLTDVVLKTFKPVKYFTENNDALNSFSYSNAGDFLITSSNDDQMVMFDCTSGTPKRTLNSKKYGVNLIQFTHSSTTAIHASTKVDVVSLCMSPIDDTFLSGALDNTIKLWDLRSQNCHGVMNVTGRPTAAFDPEGLIFAAGINSECVKLYDLRSFDKGPFATFKLPLESSGTEWTGLKFSADGRTLLIITNGNSIRLIDAFKGNLLHTFPMACGSVPEIGQSWSACFTPDSQFLLAGGLDGVVHVWNADTGMGVANLSGYEASTNQPHLAIQCIAFNPRHAMLATGTHQTSFWLPTIEE